MHILSAGSTINLSRTIFSLTYGITSRAAFGGKCKEQEEFISCVEEVVKLSGGFGPTDVFPSIKLVHVISGMRPKIEKLHHRTNRILDNIINEHKANREAPTRVKEHTDDLVDVLLNLQEHGDLEFPLTSDNIKAVILAMSEMIKTPRLMEKAQAEVRQVFGKKIYVDEGGLEELSFLKLVIKETLRLHPPAPLLLPRESQEKCQIQGYDIPLKTKVIVNARSIGRDPRYWTEPDRFYPERFLDSPIDFKGTHFELIPFGAGRRICPGISFGLANVELQLASLLYHFDWKFPGGVKHEDVDMTEVFRATVRREKYLCLIPIP